jgi:hypothetical protein
MLGCSRSAPWGRSAQIVPVACRLTAMAEDPTHSAAGHRGLITVFGGTGFLGRRIVRHLLDHGFPVRAASRHPERVGSASRPDAAPETTKADIHDETTVAPALFGAYGAVNAVSLYVERGRETFYTVHVEAAARVARLARENGVERPIHVSGIGADPASSAPYIAARGRGEIAVQQAFPGAILIRPAVMCGPDDAFLTTVVRLLRILPVYPVFGRERRSCNPSMLRTWPRGLRECWLTQAEALLLTSSPAHGSTPMKNWSGPLPIGSTLAGGSYRCHSRCGEFSPRGPSSSPALLSPAIRLRSCSATISLPAIVPAYRGWISHRRKSRISYL